jgi:hypothetical protein
MVEGRELLRGEARFLEPDLLTVGDERIRAGRVVIATGSRPLIPGAYRTLGERLLTSQSLFDLEHLPGSVTVTGFDARQTVAGLTDPEVGAVAVGALEREFPIHLGAAADFAVDGSGVRVTAGNTTVTADRLLLAHYGPQPGPDPALCRSGHRPSARCRHGRPACRAPRSHCGRVPAARPHRLAHARDALLPPGHRGGPAGCAEGHRQTSRRHTTGAGRVSGQGQGRTGCAPAPWRFCFSLRSPRTHSTGLDVAARGCSAKRRSGCGSGEERLLERLSSDHIAKRAVVADPNLALIRAEAPGTADVGGIAPNDLCVVAADLPLPTGILPVVIKRTLCGPVGYDVILTDPLALATAIAPDEGTRPVKVLPRTAMCHHTAVVLRQMDCPARRGFRQRRRPPHGTHFNAGADPVVSLQHPFRIHIRCRAPDRSESQADRQQDPGSQCKARIQSRRHFRITPCFVGFMERPLRNRSVSAKSRRVVRQPHRVSASPDAEGHAVERNATMH